MPIHTITRTRDLHVKLLMSISCALRATAILARHLGPRSGVDLRSLP